MDFGNLRNWAQSFFQSSTPVQENALPESMSQEVPVHKDLGNGFILVDPYEIDMSDAMGMDNPDFWNHKGNDQQRYRELVENWGRVHDAMENGESLDAIRSSDYPDKGMHDAAQVFFSDDRAIEVTPKEGGGYEFDGDGRHRVQMAKDLGIEIPVRDTSIQLQEQSGNTIDQNADLNPPEPEISHKFRPIETEGEEDGPMTEEAQAEPLPEETGEETGEDTGPVHSRTLTPNTEEEQEEELETLDLGNENHDLNRGQPAPQAEEEESHVAPAELDVKSPSEEDMNMAPEEENDYDYYNGMSM